MTEFFPSTPEREEIVLVLKDSRLEVKNFTEYEFNSNFLTPTDGFSFAIGAERLSDELQAALLPGAAVELRLNGVVQATGYIDSIDISASHEGGRVWRIEGRDALAQAVDACADPTQSLKEGQTLADALKTIFKDFGWSDDKHFAVSDDANIDVKSSKARAKTKRSEAKGFSRRALRQYKLHQTRPYMHESVFEFASRITQRLGLWLWASADGKTLIVDQPDFAQEPLQRLDRNAKGSTNVLDGTVKRDVTDQITHLVADGYSGGGEFGKSRVKIIMENKAVKPKTPPDLSKYVAAGAVIVNGPDFPKQNVMTVPRARVLFGHDDESQDIDQLTSYARREMALAQRKSLTARYTVEGHGQNTPDGFIPWIVNTTVQVEDEAAGLSEILYVLGRTFRKSRSGGTSTHLDLIRLNTLVFSDTDASHKPK